MRCKSVDINEKSTIIIMEEGGHDRAFRRINGGELCPEMGWLELPNLLLIPAPLGAQLAVWRREQQRLDAEQEAAANPPVPVDDFWEHTARQVAAMDEAGREAWYAANPGEIGDCIRTQVEGVVSPC